MFCALTNDQVVKFFQHIYKTIADAKGPISVEEMAKSIYGIVNSNQKNEDLALTYVSLIPQNIATAFAHSKEVRAVLRTNNVDVSHIGDLIDSWEDINKVKTYMATLNPAPEEPIKKMVTAINNTPVAFTPEQIQEGIENNAKKDSFDGKAETALTSTGLQTISADSTLVDPTDTNRITFYATQKVLATAQAEQGVPFESLELTRPDGSKVRGVGLVLMHGDNVPLDNLYNDTREALESGKKFAPGVYMVVADTNGRPLYFNEKGELTNDGEGKMSIGMIRKPVNVGGKLVLKSAQVISAQDFLAKIKKNRPDLSGVMEAALLENIELQQRTELKQLNALREAIIKDPSVTYKLKLTAVKNGVITSNYKTPTLLKQLGLNNMHFTLADHNSIDGKILAGAVYFDIPGIANNVEVLRPYISPVIANTLAELILHQYNDKNRAAKAIDQIKNFLIVDKVAIDLFVDPKGNIGVSINDENLAFSKQTLIDNFTKRKLNISRELLNNNFTYIEYQDDKPVSKEMAYNDFIIQNFATALIPGVDGKLVALNGAFQFEAPSITDLAKAAVVIEKAVPKVEVKPEEAKPAEGALANVPVSLNEAFESAQGPDEKPVVITNEPAAEVTKPQTKNDIFNDFKFNKTNELSSIATPEQIAQAKEWFDNSPLSKFIDFHDMMNIVNSNAVATFTKNGITLYTGSNNTDIYHEAWHGFSQMFLKPEVRQRLYDELKALPEYKGMSNLQVEEVIAEDFRKYVLSGSKNILDGRPVRNTIFRRIWNFLKSLFTNKTYKELQDEDNIISNLGELYTKLHKGDLGEYTFNPRNAEFGILNKGIALKDNTFLSNKESQLISESIDSIIGELMQKRGKAINSLFEQKNLLENIYQHVVKDVFKAQLNSDIDDEAKQLLQKALENFKSVVAYHSGDKKNGVIGRSKYINSLKSVSARFNEEGELIETKKEEGDDTSERNLNEQTRDSLGSKNGNEESTIEKANNETLYLIASLPQRDKNSAIITNALGFNKPVDFNIMWNKLLKLLEGALSPQEMVDRLIKDSATNPEYADIISRLGGIEEIENPSNQVSFSQVNKFWNDFNNTRVAIYEGYIQSSDGVGFVYKFKEATPVVDKVRDIFRDKFQTTNSDFTYRTKDGDRALNIGAVLEKFATKIYSKAYDKTHNKDGSLKPASEIPYTYAVSAAKRLDFIRAIGFAVSNEKEIMSSIYRMDNIDYLATALDKLNQANIEVTNPIEALQAPVHNDKKERITDGQGSEVRQILELEGKYSNDFNSYSIKNAEGNMEYEHSLNNFLTITANHLNDAVKYPTYRDVISNPMLARFDVDKNPLVRKSYWLNSMFVLDTLDAQGNIDKSNAAYGQRRLNKDGTIVKMQIANYNGIKIIDAENSVANEGSKTTALDRQSKMLMDMNSMLLVGMMELPRHASKSSSFAARMSNFDLYFPIKNFLSSSNLLDGDVFKAVKNHLVNELTRIAWAKNDGIGKNIPGYNKRSQVFNLFHDIIDRKLQTELINGIKGMKEEDIPAYVAQYDKRLQIEFKKYFDKLVIENYNEIKTAPYGFSTELVSKIADAAAKVNIKSNQQHAIETITRAFTYNAWIQNVESVNMIYGDLAFFKTEKEEFHKRNTAYSATGTIPRTDTAALKFVNAQGRLIARSMSIEEKKISNDGTFDTAILKDNIVPSAYIKEYHAMFLQHFTEAAKNLPQAERAAFIEHNMAEVIAPYEGMNEGDAQGWITMDAYRAYKMLQDKWGQDQENLYKRMANGETLDNYEIAKMVVPIKAQYSGPVQTDKLYVPGFHKFSLMPLIPQMIAGTTMEKMHRNMMEKGIDYALFESGSKLGTLTKDGEYDKMYDDYKTRTPYLGDYTKNPVFLNYLKEQVNIEPHFKDSVIFSTQLRKLIENGLFKQGVPISDLAKKFDDEFVENINRLTQLKKLQLMREVDVTQDADGNYHVNDYSKLVELIHKELGNRDLPDNVIDFIDLVKHTTENGEEVTKLKHPLDLSTSAHKIEGVLQSIVNNRLIRQKNYGEPLIQLSGAGFESDASREKYTNPTDADKAKWGTNDLPFYVPGGRTLVDGTKVTSAMKVKRALKDSDKVLFNLLHNDGEKIGYSEDDVEYGLKRLNEMLKDEKWMNANRHYVTMVGVRIPVQGYNSMEFMEVYEFLPQTAGNVIIPSSEIVAKSGSDFDIDKLTIFFPNIGKVNDQVTFFNKKDHTMTTEQINDKYYKLITAQKAKNDAIRESFNTQFEKFKNKLKLTESDQATLNKMDAEYEEQRAPLQKQLDAYAIEFRKIMAGRSRLDYGKQSQLEEDYFNAQIELENLNRNNYQTKQTYYDAFKEHYKDQIKGERELAMVPANKEIERLRKEMTALRGSDIKAVENALIDNIRNILEMESSAVDLLRPNGTDIVKPVADKLANNFEYSSKLSKVSDQKEDKVSPTRVVEQRYNLYKHESNSIGKATLGIGAIDNTFNALLNKAGAYLNQAYVSPFDKKRRGTPIRMLLEHNTIIVNSNEHISLSHIYDKEGRNKIGDVISQLMNGWVDIEKEAWIFNVNGGIDAAPAILLMNQAGVPFDQIAKFVTQPIILEYVSALQGKNNLFKKVNNQEYFARYKQNVQYAIFTKYLDSSVATKKDIDELIDAGDHPKLFTKEGLSRTDHSYKEQAAYLHHFIELTQLADALGGIKTSLNFDTSKSRNLYDATEKIGKYSEAQKMDLVPSHVLNALKNNSVISSFAVQKLSLSLWTKVLPLRNAPIVNNYIHEMINRDINMRMRAKIAEKFARTFKNDLMEYILQELALPLTAPHLAKNQGELWKSWFIGDNTMGTQLVNIKQKYPELVAKYDLLASLVRNQSKQNYLGTPGQRLVNIKLVDGVLDTDRINKYDEQFKQLIDPTVMKVEDPKENTEITIFFKNLAVFGLLQSGLNKSPISWTEIIPQSAYTGLMTQALDAVSKNVNEEFLDKFYAKFRAINRNLYGHADQESYRLKDYILNPEDHNYDTIIGFENHSGGAEGADEAWDQIGRRFGFMNHTHWREPGKNTVDSPTLRKANIKAKPANPTDYAEGKIKATRAAQQMHRKISENYSYYQYRNWLQVKNADAIFAISTILAPGEKDSKGYTAKSLQVAGGTGYAVQMAINEGKPVYVFDQRRNGWYEASYNTDLLGNKVFNKFVSTTTPTLTEKYAGIGTHKNLTKEGYQAIIDVYHKTRTELDPNRAPVDLNTDTSVGTDEGYTEEEEKAPSKNEYGLTKENFEFPEGYDEAMQQANAKSITTVEKAQADKWTPIQQNFKDSSQRKMRPEFKGKSTMDLIFSGDRTRTTRAKTDIDRMMKDYKLSNIEDLVGKVIRMTDKEGRTAYTRITKVTPFTQEYQDATWEKEGWVKDQTDQHIGTYPYAIEFELAGDQSQSTQEERGYSMKYLAMKDATDVYKKVNAMAPVISAEALAHAYIAGGGLIDKANFYKEVITRRDTRLSPTKQSNAEAESRNYVVDKGGKSVEEAAHSIWNNLEEMDQADITTQDIRNELINVISSYTKSVDAARDYLAKYGEDNRKDEVQSEFNSLNYSKDQDFPDINQDEIDSTECPF